MIEVRLSASFRSWLTALEDRKARNRITVRITRAEAGLLGDVKSIGDGVSEMRVTMALATDSTSPVAGMR